ncbi:hypothetical protein HPB48_005036 [Haemaphysalis longicornis]|uniref:Ig-like domain-containing protein n=1 Tax=Haemaphysalis longicornis TaxID=44386 RepID=A0A9J6GDU1_HAELO|nr:hypothetical protein HPB48_005036 [Haemaphysalis longicornis]
MPTCASYFSCDRCAQRDAAAWQGPVGACDRGRPRRVPGVPRLGQPSGRDLRWLHRGLPLEPGNATSGSPQQASPPLVAGPYLIMRRVRPLHAGDYACEASNQLASVRSNIVHLTVQCESTSTFEIDRVPYGCVLPPLCTFVIYFISLHLRGGVLCVDNRLVCNSKSISRAPGAILLEGHCATKFGQLSAECDGW